MISCLRKQIAFSKMTQKPVTDLDQFISLPMALSDEDGVPIKAVKSTASHVLRSWYSESFISVLPGQPYSFTTAIIIEGMFIINTSPLATHRTFDEYAEFLFSRWVTKPQILHKAVEIHVVFDHPNRNGTSPKDIERTRRDVHALSDRGTFESNSCDLVFLPKANWRNFLSDRVQKRQLVHFLSHKFLELSQKKFQECDCLFVTSGGFDGEKQDKAFGTHHGMEIFEIPELKANHEEADTRVWLHTAHTLVKTDRVLIYSPDTDIVFIGLPLVKHFLGKSVFVQLKNFSIESEYIDMTKLIDSLFHDLQMHCIDNIPDFLQALYILSGCDFVSFFHGYGKKTFFETFRKNAHFILDETLLTDTETDSGFCAFLKIILCVYFCKHRAAFQPHVSVKELCQTFSDQLDITTLKAITQHFREKMWERIDTEKELLPNLEALHLHWKRCCWVILYWKQALCNTMNLPPLEDFGWQFHDHILTVVWDTETNYKKVNDTIQWYTKGCACKSGCITNRCSCYKNKKQHCRPGCKCINCKNVPTLSELKLSDDDIDESFEVDDEFDENETEFVPISESEFDEIDDAVHVPLINASEVFMHENMYSDYWDIEAEVEIETT